MDRLFTIYRHVSPIGRVYVGTTSQDVETRWRHGDNYRNSPYFKRAIRKYGWKNFKHEILFTNVEEERAKRLEIELIRHYKGLGISYNLTNGGDGTNGYHHTDEYKQFKSQQMKEFFSTERGKEICAKGGKTNLGKKYNRKSGFTKGDYQVRIVCQYSLEGVLLNKFKSVSDASRKTGANNCQIGKCLRGKAITAKNFIWRYE
nr:MAG TPA: intron associated endonuclease [Caudoviricetes sp.]